MQTANHAFGHEGLLQKWVGCQFANTFCKGCAGIMSMIPVVNKTSIRDVKFAQQGIAMHTATLQATILSETSNCHCA
jgi:hypothetical protein